MVKHTQTSPLLLPTICLSAFDHFVGLALKGLSTTKLRAKRYSKWRQYASTQC